MQTAEKVGEIRKEAPCSPVFSAYFDTIFCFSILFTIFDRLLLETRNGSVKISMEAF